MIRRMRVVGLGAYFLGMCVFRYMMPVAPGGELKVEFCGRVKKKVNMLAVAGCSDSVRGCSCS